MKTKTHDVEVKIIDQNKCHGTRSGTIIGVQVLDKEDPIAKAMKKLTRFGVKTERANLQIMG